MKRLSDMTDDEFAAHIAKQETTLAEIAAGVADLKTQYAAISAQLDELLRPQRDADDAAAYRNLGSPMG